MDKLIDKFTVVDEDGNRLTLLEYQKMIPAGSKDDPHATIPGMKRTVTESGRAVNWVNETTFTLVSTGQTLRRLS